ELAVLPPLGAADGRRLLRQRERRDFDARVAGLADGPARPGERPSLEGLVTHCMAKVLRHETPVYDERFRPATAGLSRGGPADLRNGGHASKSRWRLLRRKPGQSEGRKLGDRESSRRGRGT